jgi:protoheme IX farnesyltransferase
MASQTQTAAERDSAETQPSGLVQTLLDYRELTKPKIVHLLVLTAFCTMLVAASGLPAIGLVAWTILGTTLVCGSAQVINMVWDRDIDAIMERTADRPIVQGRVKVIHALIFSAILGIAGTGVLAYFANPMAALMGVAGHIYYAVVYTMWLKRSTPQNIVIGGGAGAFPVLIGWAAVTGSLSVTAWLLFAVIFFWTPPHFWALALYKDIEYEKAGVPMMPVARGEETTKFQMMLYTTLLVSTSALLGLVGMMGIVYFASAILLGAGFAFVTIKTAFSEGDRWAKRTFAYSIIYLALLFGAMSVDSLSTQHFTEQRQMASLKEERTIHLKRGSAVSTSTQAQNLVDEAARPDDDPAEE